MNALEKQGLQVVSSMITQARNDIEAVSLEWANQVQWPKETQVRWHSVLIQLENAAKILKQAVENK